MEVSVLRVESTRDWRLFKTLLEYIKRVLSRLLPYFPAYTVPNMVLRGPHATDRIAPTYRKGFIDAQLLPNTFVAVRTIVRKEKSQN